MENINKISGYGDGSGSGYGYGYGYGSGSSSSYGSGDGSGFGYGYGYGHGDGSGDGSGDGYGSGSGEIDSDYLNAVLDVVAGSKGLELARKGAELAFWRSTATGGSANGGKGARRETGDVEEIAGPLKLCGPGALHATLNPRKWKGKRLWVVALYPPIAYEQDKMGSLKREIIAEVKPNFFA